MSASVIGIFVGILLAIAAILGGFGGFLLALGLGLIGLVGILVCGGLTLVVSPFAWVIGGRALREIDENPSAYSGREMASAGRVMGIVGTGLLALGVLAVIVFFALVVGVATTSP